MSKVPCAPALGFGLWLLASGFGYAEPASTDPADRTIRPGDKIEWTIPFPHALRVGVDKSDFFPPTPLADVDKILTFSPDLLRDEDGMARSFSDVTVTGTVKDDAATQGVAEFVFTCREHPFGMRSLPFRVAATDGHSPRTLKIRATPGANHWILQKDGGDVQVDVD